MIKSRSMSYSYDDKKTSFNMTSNTFHPININNNTSPSQAQLTVEFDFFLKSDKLIIVEGRDSTIPLLQFFPPSFRRASASVAVTGGESLDGMLDAVAEAIGDRLDENGLVGLVFRSWEEVGQRFLTRTGALKEGGVLRLGFDVQIEDWHVYVVGSGGGGGGVSMIPAADSSFEMLEKYEVRGVEEKKGCCICLEELGGCGGAGGGALRMPCLHVFHGGCIRKWLRKSHYCPLCRYEMPTN